MDPAETQPDPVQNKRVPWTTITIGAILTIFLAIVAAPWCSNAVTNQKVPSALSYIKQVNLGILMFENRYGNSAPEMANVQLFQAMLLPYVGDSAVFNDPDTGKPFVPNSILSHADLSKLAKPQLTVLLYDATPQNGKRTVAYADGHAKQVPEAQFEQQLSATPNIPRGLGPLVGGWTTTSGTLIIEDDGSAALQTLGGKSYAGEAVVDARGYLTVTFDNSGPKLYRHINWSSVYEASLIARKPGSIRYPVLP